MFAGEVQLKKIFWPTLIKSLALRRSYGMPWLIDHCSSSMLKKDATIRLAGSSCSGGPMYSNISLQPPNYPMLPLLTWWEELLLTLICLRFFVQSDFVGHLISEIASDMRGMLARQRCFMLLSMLAPSNLGQMSNRSNPIFEHQLCVCCICTAPYTFSATNTCALSDFH